MAPQRDTADNVPHPIERHPVLSPPNIFLAVAFVLFALAGACQAETLYGRVVKIADGDTLTILDGQSVQHKVRLSGIDAPEKVQAFGNVSRQHLATLTFGKQVTVETSKKDRYKRNVGKVVVEGKDANLAQIEAGLAWHYREYAREQSHEDRESYAAAEESARVAQRGLWRDTQPTPPWAYRKSRR